MRATSSVREPVLHSVCFIGVTSGMDLYTTEVKVPNNLSLIKVSGCNAAGIVTFIGAVGRKPMHSAEGEGEGGLLHCGRNRGRTDHQKSARMKEGGCHK